MKKENLPVKNVTIENPMEISDEVMKNVNSKVDETKTFVDPLKLTYQLSEHYLPGKNEIGDFYFQENSLGDSIDVYIPYYTYKIVCMTDGGTKFGGAIQFPYSESDYPSTKEYKDFIEGWSKVDKSKVDEGIDLLCYIPSLGQWGSLFCKGVTHSGCIKILNTMKTKQHFFFKLSSGKKEGKKYLLLNNQPIEAIPIDITIEDIRKQASLMLRKAADEPEVKKSR